MSIEPSADDQQKLITWLTHIDQELRSRHPGYVYHSHEGLILAHGRWFQIKPTRFKGIPKACFYNAWRVVKRYSERGYQYCEGYIILSNGFVTPHAWVGMPDGTGFDPTLQGWQYETVMPVGWFGIPFLIPFCLDRHQYCPPEERYSIFQNDYRTQYQLLREGLPDTAIAQFPMTA